MNPRNHAKNASKSGAKAKPMVVWAIMDGPWPVDVYRHKQHAIEYRAGYNDRKLRVVEFREHRLARKARGK